MPRKRLENCCFCFEAHQGAILLAVVHILYSMASFWPCVGNYGTLTDAFLKEITPNKFETLRLENREYFLAAEIAFDCIIFIINVSLLHGLLQRRPNYMLPYLAVQLCGLLVSEVILLDLLYLKKSLSCSSYAPLEL